MSGRFFVEPDGDGVPELWCAFDKPGGPHLVAWQYGHLKRSVSVQQDYGDLIWRVITSVLAPDEETVERVARALHSTCYEGVLGFHGHMHADRNAARAALAALADPDTGGRT